MTAYGRHGIDIEKVEMANMAVMGSILKKQKWLIWPSCD
jgi:4'-phosphopantetheinyl transferase EntD